MTMLEILKDLQLVFGNDLTDAQKLNVLERCVEGYILTEEMTRTPLPIPRDTCAPVVFIPRECPGYGANEGWFKESEQSG